jgi:hypothetical protein
LGRKGALEGRGNTARLQLTVGCEAEHDDAEDELSDAHWEDPVDGHFDGVEILSDRVMFLDATIFNAALNEMRGKEMTKKQES